MAKGNYSIRYNPDRLREMIEEGMVKNRCLPWEADSQTVSFTTE